MRIDEAKKLFPKASFIRTEKSGGKFIIVGPDDEVVYALVVHIFEDVPPDTAPEKRGRETCLDVFTPDTRGVEVAHFTTRGQLDINEYRYVDEDAAHRRGMHMVSVIRRPGGVK